MKETDDLTDSKYLSTIDKLLGEMANHPSLSDRLTRRDYFAAAALQGLLAANGGDVALVDSAVRHADALIEALKRSQPPA